MTLHDPSLLDAHPFLVVLQFFCLVLVVNEKDPVVAVRLESIAAACMTGIIERVGQIPVQKRFAVICGKRSVCVICTVIESLICVILLIFDFVCSSPLFRAELRICYDIAFLE